MIKINFKQPFLKIRNVLIKNKKYFSEIVKIPYDDLYNINKTEEIFIKIENAYGSDGLGLLVIEKVPDYINHKNNLLRLISELVKLPQNVLQRLERPEINYSLGWSFGKEYFNDKPDFLKASFYAELLSQSGSNPIERNEWPKELPELREAFHSLGGIIRNNGIKLLSLIDLYIRQKFPKYNIDYPSLIKKSSMNTGRMLYYYPKKYAKGHDVDGENWCDWHNDHGSLTGLVSAMYVDESGKEATVNVKETGLYIQNRKGEIIRASYGKNDIAYQLGETLQIHSGGILHATPHAVKVMNDIPDDIARVTFALFMEPDNDIILNIPEGATMNEVKTSNIYKVPKLQDRFKPGMTFGDFTIATYSKFYK